MAKKTAAERRMEQMIGGSALSARPATVLSPRNFDVAGLDDYDAERDYFARIPANQIETDPTQPRKFFDQTALGDLAASIAVRLLHPPAVTKLTGGRYRLDAGERRLRAMRDLLGWTEIPCMVHPQPDSDMRLPYERLEENLQREDLTPYERIMAEYEIAQRDGLGPYELAERLHNRRSKESISRDLTVATYVVANAQADADLQAGRTSVDALYAKAVQQNKQAGERRGRPGKVKSAGQLFQAEINHQSATSNQQLFQAEINRQPPSGDSRLFQPEINQTAGVGNQQLFQPEIKPQQVMGSSQLFQPEMNQPPTGDSSYFQTQVVGRVGSAQADQRPGLPQLAALLDAVTNELIFGVSATDVQMAAFRRAVARLHQVASDTFGRQSMNEVGHSDEQTDSR